MSYPLLYAILSVIGTVAAQIFMKQAGVVHKLELRWFAFIGASLFLYGIAYFGYYMSLRYWDISKIAPVLMAATVALIASYGFFIGEGFNLQKILGIILAILAILLITRS